MFNSNIKDLLSQFFKGEKRLSGYLSLAAVLVALVPMLAVYVIVTSKASSALTQTLTTDVRDKALLVADSLNSFYEERLYDIKILSQADVFESTNAQVISQYLSEIKRESPFLSDISVTDLDGSILASARYPKHTGQSIYARIPATQALVNIAVAGVQGDVVVSDIVDIGSAERGIVLATPITDDTNKHVIKVLMVVTRISIPASILVELKQHFQQNHGDVHILDRQGELIASTDEKLSTQEIFVDSALLDAIRLLPVGSVGHETSINEDERAIIGGFSAMARIGLNQGLGWTVLATVPLDSFALPLNSLKKQIGIAVFLVGLLVFVVMFMLSNRLARLVWLQANYDPLSGLPNRRLFMDRLGQGIKVSRRADLSMALLIIDLDKFKEINDSLGHHAGDRLLVLAVQRILLCVRSVDTVARLGGDEFAVILNEVSDLHRIERIAQQINEALAQPYTVFDDLVNISASIGITLYPQDGQERKALLINCDQALYASKSAGGDQFNFYTRDMQDSARRRLYLINELRQAMGGNQLELYYQPIVCAKSGRVVKAEALLRWFHPVEGQIGPADFIPLAEETNLIVELGDWVFKEAARQAKLWQQTYDPAFQISINVSPIQFEFASLHEGWAAYLGEIDLSGGGVVVEITEGVLMDEHKSSNDQLLHFRDMGIQVAIDDFGTGYSTLSYLKKYDIDYLKIDKSLIDDIVTDPHDVALSEAVVVMAHKLGLSVIAEGVETRAQYQVLKNMGCDYIQGYLFAKPLSKNDFSDYLEQRLLPGAPGGAECVEIEAAIREYK